MGARQTTLKAIYSGLIKSILDYRCVVYRSAASTSLKELYNIHYQASKLRTGAFKITLTAALKVEIGEMPLEMRRIQLSLNYWANLQGHSQDQHKTL